MTYKAKIKTVTSYASFDFYYSLFYLGSACKYEFRARGW